MWQLLRKRIGSRDGFTLIELVVVVAILGILAVVITPKVLGAIDNAKDNGNKSGAKQIQVGLERIYAESGSYPTEVGLCGVGSDGDPCAPASIKTALASYVNLDAAQISAATYAPAAGSYTLTLTFANNSKVYTVTPSAVSVAP